ncbi:TrkA C-terminal domain-containing protein [Ramlibacter sp. PS3R-8]|uniref:aspartate:alanine exchanger family transporter n=1 Tax=Ramlibacter sp. PS3R-8 TaxID=3133437 RepID=UPI00309A2F78
MDALRSLLESQLLLTMFLTIGLGYLVGEINIKGFSLGAGAVLFVGLAIGGLAPKSAPPALVGTLGLVLFLYGVGIQYGAQFFKGLTSAEGLKANAAATAAVVLAGLVSLALVPLFGVKADEALGIFAGAGTSTATLQAIIASLKSDGAAVGYGVAYPFGVAIPILSIHLLNVWMKPKFDTAAKNVEAAEIALRNPDLVGLTLADLRSRLPAGVGVIAVRREHQNQLPDDALVLRSDDVVMATASAPDALAAAVTLIGELHRGRMVGHSADLGYLRVFASAGTVVGQSLGSLRFPDGVAASIAHVRRGDADMMPHPDLILEVGDRVGLLASRSHTKALRKFFGDSIKGTADLSFIAMGIGVALGLLLGLVPLPIPGVGKLTLGLAGMLLFALWLGKMRRTGPFVWSMPFSANLVLRNFGLTVFLAQVGLASGPKFFNTVGATGVTYLVYAIVVTFILVLVTAVLCLWIFRMPFDTSIGVVAGATGNPAIAAFASKTAPTDRPDVGYAMIFPSMTIAKILFVQIAAVMLV